MFTRLAFCSSILALSLAAPLCADTNPPLKYLGADLTRTPGAPPNAKGKTLSFGPDLKVGGEGVVGLPSPRLSIQIMRGNRTFPAGLTNLTPSGRFAFEDPAFKFKVAPGDSVQVVAGDHVILQGVLKVVPPPPPPPPR